MRYQIQGETLPVVICELEGGEKMITEGGGMAWMSPNMLMETTTNGGIGKAFGRMFSGEHMFQNIYTAQGGPGMIAFASSFPGSVRAFQIAPGQEMILQKSAFLAGEMGIELSVFFNKKFSSGLFGGEGFIMQKVSGHGIVFTEFDGHVIEYELQPGQQIVVDTGHLAHGDQERAGRKEYAVRRRGNLQHGNHRAGKSMAPDHANQQRGRSIKAIYSNRCIIRPGEGMGLQIFIHMLPAVLAGRAAHISLEDLAIIGRRGESGHAGCFCNAFPVFQKQKAVLDP